MRLLIFVSRAQEHHPEEWGDSMIIHRLLQVAQQGGSPRKRGAQVWEHPLPFGKWASGTRGEIRSPVGHLRGVPPPLHGEELGKLPEALGGDGVFRGWASQQIRNFRSSNAFSPK